MNYVLIVVLVLVAVQACWGFQSGLVKSIQRFIGWIVAGVAFVLLDMMVRFFQGKNNLYTFLTFLLLSVLVLAWRIVHVVLLPAKMLAKLPVVHGADKVLGVVFGIIEVAILVWLVDALLQNFGFGEVGAKLTYYMKENKVLNWMYENNYLLVFEKWVEGRIVGSLGH